MEAYYEVHVDLRYMPQSIVADTGSKLLLLMRS